MGHRAAAFGHLRRGFDRTRRRDSSRRGLRDLWAGNPYFDAGGRLLSRLEAGSLRDARAVVTVTPGCRDGLLRLHPELRSRLHLLPNGFDPSLPALRNGRALSGTGRATLIHAGALYGDRSAAALVRGLARFAPGRARLELLGPVDPATKEAIRAAPPGLDVALLPPVDWREAIERVLGADISVVINSPRTGGAMALPTKLYEALALGRPVLALTPAGSDTERLLHELAQDAGAAPPDDEVAIAEALTRLLEGTTGPGATRDALRVRPRRRRAADRHAPGRAGRRVAPPPGSHVGSRPDRATRSSAPIM